MTATLCLLAFGAVMVYSASSPVGALAGGGSGAGEFLRYVAFVALGLGLLAGISGTLSMAGGVYLSARSEALVNKGSAGDASGPRKEAAYTGFWYFVGSLVPVLPFMLGLQGLAGDLLAMVSVGAALAVASAVIAIMSGTSIRRRAVEMVVISLGAALVTITIGILAKHYFGFTI